jgi:hypothetical protein
VRWCVQYAVSVLHRSMSLSGRSDSHGGRRFHGKRKLHSRRSFNSRRFSRHIINASNHLAHFVSKNFDTSPPRLTTSSLNIVLNLFCCFWVVTRVHSLVLVLLSMMLSILSGYFHGHEEIINAIGMNTDRPLQTF